MSKGSVPTTKLPITFFDFLRLGKLTTAKRLYFYEFPSASHDFAHTIIPMLKQSLSFTLQHFFPLAGNLIHGNSIPLNLLESKADFNHLIGNHPRDLIEFEHLVQKLPPIHLSNDTFVFSLLALQATIFPNIGICIGITFLHLIHHFAFPVDCRNLLQFPAQIMYFGNCLAPCIAGAKKSELLLENGMIVRVKAIENGISKLKPEPLEGAETWMSDLDHVSKLGRILTVAGSPKLRPYETDFGWGRPKKTEVVHVNDPTGITLNECGDEKDGIEVGVVLSKRAMDTFRSTFARSLYLGPSSSL
ncbi:hypothetical protein I3843_03G162900 [Carya illinoinensis]|nr:hypothetical protein I3843_03G162900 [Carya illinoinensis]